MAKDKPKYKVFDPTIDDAINMAGILSAGGLAGQASEVLGRIEQEGAAAGMAGIGRLVMGALANPASREEMRSFLFQIWRTTEDDQALEADRGLDDRLERRYDDTGELEKDSPYYKKLKKFHKLPASALLGIAKSLYATPNFKDFLASVRELLPEKETSEEQSTNSKGTTSLESVK